MGFVRLLLFVNKITFQNGDKQIDLRNEVIPIYSRIQECDTANVFGVRPESSPVDVYGTVIT